MNLSLDIGNLEAATCWSRCPTYHAQYDVFPNGLVTTSLWSWHFRSYGVQLEYNYR